MKEAELKKIWKENGFPSASRLWAILRQRGLHADYNKSEVVKYIAKQDVTQLHHKPVKAKYSHISTIAPGIMYCIDLLDMSAYGRYNGGIKWLLLCIDIFSRVAAVVPVQNKTAVLVSEALKKACKEIGGFPKVILSDQGSEFKGATEKLLKDNSILHRLADVGDHRRLGIVDRFSAIVKGWVAKYMTYNQTKSYVDELPEMVSNYNKAPHSSLGGMSPNEAWMDENKARDYHYERIKKGMTGKKNKNGIAVGDWVRVLKLRGVFDKQYNVKFSLTTYQVVDIKGLNYFLDNGKFYRAARLLKVPPPEEEASAPVRDVGKEARRERKRELILQQEGVDPVANPELRRSARERKPSSQLEDVRYGKVKY
jgi:transposase InsO family protein